MQHVLNNFNNCFVMHQVCTDVKHVLSSKSEEYVDLFVVWL